MIVLAIVQLGLGELDMSEKADEKANSESFSLPRDLLESVADLRKWIDFPRPEGHLGTWGLD